MNYISSSLFKLFLSFIFIVGNLKSYAQNNANVIPAPRQIEKFGGQFVLNNGTSIFSKNKLLQPQCKYLVQEIFSKVGIACFIGKTENTSIQLSIANKPKQDQLAYSITITSTQIKIIGNSAEGVFNGLQSFLQLAMAAKQNKNGINLPSVKIFDEPIYAWRGFMLDESRHFFGKKKVKQLLDWMAFYKLNRFHWHLTDEPAWRLAINNYPKLTTIGSIGSFTNAKQPAQFYTQADVKEIVAYAKELFIEVIPEIDMPGHATAANKAYPEFSGGGSKKHPEFTFNPANEKTYQYLTNILKETNQLFPSKITHLGGDEVSFGTEKWNTDSVIVAFKNRNKFTSNTEVERYFMKRMADSVYSMNANILAWDEIVESNLPIKNTLILWWRHDKLEQLNKSLSIGYKTILCPRLPLYFDFVQDSTHQYGRKWGGKFNDLLSVYNFRATNYVSEPNSIKNIIGIQANLWTETVTDEHRFDYLIFPRIAALAETAWTEPKGRNDEKFLERLKVHMEYYKNAGLYFYNPFNKKQQPEPPATKRIEQDFTDG